MTYDTLSKFGPTFQAKSISVMLTDKPFLDQAIDIIDCKHFESDSHSWIVDRIQWYFASYKDIPSMEVFKKELDKIVNNDSLKSAVILSLKEIYKNIQASDIKYVKDEYLEFCKNQALKNAILKSAEKLQTGDYDSIKSVIDKALHAGQERNYGHDWKGEIDKRVTDNVRNTIATGWEVINQIMDGGLSGGELGVIVAPPGIGKSWALSKIGLAPLYQGKKVVHYTLELGDKYTGVRYDTLTIGKPPNEIKNNVELLRKSIEQITGELKIKYYPTKAATSLTIRAHMERLISTGFSPDLIIVDYADLLRPTEKGDARYMDLGIIYEDLRGISGELSVPLWTASQSQRSSMNDDVIGGDKIAESFNKIMTADFIMSISRKISDKISNTARVHIIKNRFGPDGITMPAYVNFVEGKFEIYDENSPEGIRMKKQMSNGDDILKNLIARKAIDLSTSASPSFEDGF